MGLKIKILIFVCRKHLLLNQLMQKQSPEVFYEKKLFLEISQNSQENTCATVSFLKKLQA